MKKDCRTCKHGEVAMSDAPCNLCVGFGGWEAPEIEEQPEDIIANPAHYASAGGLQPIELIMSADHDGKFCKGSIIKYAFRAGSKIYDGLSAKDSEIKDLEKIIQYSEFRIRQLKGLPVIERP